MKIKVVIEVPDGDACNGCDLWYRDQATKDCYCLLFGMIKLEQRYKKTHGLDIVKCQKCTETKESMGEKKEGGGMISACDEDENWTNKT